jgi:hypothetical protein
MPSLSSHPIFLFESSEANVSKGTARRNVVAFKGTEVYVAVGSTVRYADLREWFALEDGPGDKKYYKVPPVLIR